MLNEERKAELHGRWVAAHFAELTSEECFWMFAHCGSYRPIPVSERLPDINVPVLARAPTQWDGWRIVVLRERTESSGVAWIEEDDCGGITVKQITHWLPMPPDPE